MKRLQKILLSLAVALGIALPVFALPTSVAALSPFDNVCQNNQTNTVCKGTNETLFGPNSIWNKIVNLILLFVGIIATIVLIIGGMRYVLSGGDSKAVEDAKNTIIYAIVGIVIAMLASALVNFVLAKI